MSTQELLNGVRVIPVIVIDDVKRAEPLVEALLAGGMNVIEVTFRTTTAPEAIETIVKAFPEMLVGVGTVLNTDQAQRALDAGAQFGLAPGINPKVVSFFNQANTPFIPGVMTPSEIEQGIDLGCHLLKFFPAENAGGVKMLEAMSAPYVGQSIQFCPTGGIDLQNMGDYLSLSEVAAVGGSWIATRKQIADRDWATITQQVKDTLGKAAAIDNRIGPVT